MHSNRIAGQPMTTTTIRSSRLRLIVPTSIGAKSLQMPVERAGERFADGRASRHRQQRSCHKAKVRGALGSLDDASASHLAARRFLSLRPFGKFSSSRDDDRSPAVCSCGLPVVSLRASAR